VHDEGTPNAAHDAADAVLGLLLAHFGCFLWLRADEPTREAAMAAFAKSWRRE
jgi:hypothetical protein